MKRGQRPKPTFLRVINGNPREKPLNHNEPQPTGNLTAAPDWLTPSQKEGWDYAIANAPPGLLKYLDRSVLTIWVIAEDCHRQAAQKVAQHGMLIKAPNTGLPIQTPYMAIQNKQSSIMLRAAAELGFSPSSRSQISTDPVKSNAFANNGRRPA